MITGEDKTFRHRDEGRTGRMQIRRMNVCLTTTATTFQYEAFKVRGPGKALDRTVKFERLIWTRKWLILMREGL
jgi:hypothetical protein